MLDTDLYFCLNDMVAHGVCAIVDELTADY